MSFRGTFLKRSFHKPQERVRPAARTGGRAHLAPLWSPSDPPFCPEDLGVVFEEQVLQLSSAVRYAVLSRLPRPDQDGIRLVPCRASAAGGGSAPHLLVSLMPIVFNSESPRIASPFAVRLTVVLLSALGPRRWRRRGGPVRASRASRSSAVRCSASVRPVGWTKAAHAVLPAPATS